MNNVYDDVKWSYTHHIICKKGCGVFVGLVKIKSKPQHAFDSRK